MKKSYYNTSLLKSIFVTSAIIILAFLIISSFLLDDERYDKEHDKDLGKRVEIPPLSLEESEKSEIESIVVYNHLKGKKTEKELEEYLKGVVASEMPPGFDIEALKAQAVMARTYTISRLSKFGGSGCDHKSGADVCTNPDHCQDWIQKSEAVNSWGKDGEKLWDKVEKSVTSTSGKILTYNGQPLKEAPYHSTCGGKTELSSKVWESEKPYIISVECDFCDHSHKYEDQKILSEDQITELIPGMINNFSEVATDNILIEVINRSSTGRVLEAKVGSKTFEGRDVRKMLGLNSTNFSVKNISENEWFFETKGFGHGVGFCQYGADGKAKEGFNYIAILNYYFRNVEIKRLY